MCSVLHLLQRHMSDVSSNIDLDEVNDRDSKTPSPEKDVKEPTPEPDKTPTPTPEREVSPKEVTNTKT